ncbi:MAG TPA: prolyl oligopeptidase family serine peptidase [Thermoanaerobaculia bacterium]|nr:prolyl oligopeptidase family serine peptidase [Thermoanaerobaculia bacterium]
MKVLLRSVALATIPLLLSPAFAQPRLQTPETRRIGHVEVIHGVEVADPYRWLEGDVRVAAEVQRWIEAQNRVTFRYLASLPSREAIEKRLTALWNYEKITTPVKAGGRYHFKKNAGLQNQYVLWVQDSLVEEPRVLLDPNGWSKDGTIALADTTFSDDGRWLAYAVAEAGSDWVTWRVMEVATGKLLPDELRWVKFSGVSWTRDGKGFFYSRYPEPEEGRAYQSLNRNMKVYYHRVGTPQSDDVLVYHRPEQPDWGYTTKVTDDGRYLILTFWKGTDAKYQVHVKDLEDPYGMPAPLIDTFDREYSFIGNDGPKFYFLTDLDAPLRRVISIDLDDPAPSAWTTVIPQAESMLEDVDYVGNLFIAQYLEDARSEVKIYTNEGKHVRDVELGQIGRASGFGGRRTDTETFYSFSSFTTPPSIYRYDVATGDRKLIHRSTVDFDPDDYEVRQVFYESKDGTRVPMFIAHRKGLELDGSNPTLLYGYGGFNISMTPGFSPARLIWMEMGGVFAMPNLRGGGEYGEEWHQAGTRLEKQNVFDDFIAAAEWLIDSGYTRPEKLAISGGSNGGLLVGAAMTQRPDLFGAALPAVGVMDMLRFHHFTAGRFWVDDYGSTDDPEEFAALLAYSPYHNLRPADYPATLVTTADTDDRVIPAHSFKFAAALQHAHRGTDPVLIRIETRAGHGAGKPVSKVIAQTADQWAFLAENLGMALSPPYARSD